MFGAVRKNVNRVHAMLSHPMIAIGTLKECQCPIAEYGQSHSRIGVVSGIWR